MTISLMVAVVMVGTFAGEALATESAIFTVCVDPRDANPGVLYRSQSTTSRLLAEAGVTIVWRTKDRPCRDLPSRSFVIQISTRTAADVHPGAYAYAQPYDRSIVVFYDRILGRYPAASEVQILLGHVMAHEIVHMLQGVARHSESGLMKASWTNTDHAAMQLHPLWLAEDDVSLIQSGLLKQRNVELLALSK